MEYKTLTSLSANLPADFKPSYNELKTSLMALADPRRQTANKRYPLWSMLLAVVAALLSQQLSLVAAAEWLAAQSETTKQALGFSDGKTPHPTTFARLFGKLKSVELETVLSGFFDPKMAEVVPAPASQAIAIDGKSQRGRLKFEVAEPGTPIHLLSLYSHDTGLVLAQSAVVASHNEISTAPTLLRQIRWQGRVLTGDATFCQREICKQVVEAGGDYLFVVKGNQPNLLLEIETLFDLKLLPKGLAFDVRECKTVDKGHGRIELRQIRASAELAELSDWPYLAQVVEIKREWLEKGLNRQEVSYGVTSLTTAEADVASLLKLKREHWGIENRLHWVRDVVFGEDKSLTRLGSTPQVMAALRNTVIGLLRRGGFSQLTSRLRYNASHPEAVLALLGLANP
jgi:predicted transposase YbfD/YdcC